MKQEQSSPRKITAKDVALLAGVSEATVSRVFSNSTSIRQQHRQAVIKAAEELGYISSKQPLRTKVTTIAFCLRKLENEAMQNPYFSHVLYGVQAECNRRKAGLQLLTIDSSSPTQMDDFCRVVRQGGINALLLVNLLDEDKIRQILKIELPTVLIEDYFPVLPVDGVMSDAFNGISIAMQYLFKNGHSTIAMVDGPHKHSQARMRFLAYRHALDQTGIVYDPDLVAVGNLQVDGGIQAINTILEKGKDFTAVLCSNDTTAFGVMQVLRERGLRIPEDISVVGHDDVDAASLVTPRLTTVQVRMNDIGQIATARLFERIVSPELTPMLFLTQEKLLERDSVRAIL